MLKSLRFLAGTGPVLIGILLVSSCTTQRYRRIAVEEYQDKVYASWLGQIIGNIYGLPHENRYVEEPGPEEFPYGYRGRALEVMQEVNGAFSDDDTDIEYMYLLAMEKYGIEPSYADLADSWLYHVRDRVWLANRAALAFMHFGYTPPVTGLKEINPHWYQIDPQLVNEIWAVTTPGMVQYAAAKSDWAARITNDDWGIEPTIHYGAMYAAAFFESDIHKLIDIGTRALPRSSRFAQTVEDMKRLYRKYPHDWKQSRKEMAEMYYHNEPLETRTIWNANLNGACGILALLYGEGDFQKTLDLACAMGFDADNQAATMSGLLGVISGTDGLPSDLLRPLPDAEWKLPFNDVYKNVSRFDMADASLKDMASRIAEQGERIILSEGGQKITEDGIEYYQINSEAEFVAALEFPGAPEPYLEAGMEVEHSLYLSGGKPPFEWRVISGSLPVGIQFDNGVISGTPTTPGVYRVVIEVSQGDTQIHHKFSFVVRDRNLAPTAYRILTNVPEPDVEKREAMWLTVAQSLYTDDIECIRDGTRLGDGSTYYSISSSANDDQHYFGYEWNESQNVGLLDLHTGSVEENGGWFTSLNVEYLDRSGDWQSVEDLVISSALIPGEERFNKPHFVEYLLAFNPVETSGIRIIGNAGGVEHWYSTFTRFTSITELSVHGPLPDYHMLTD
ncbi:ADP-ribosylglycohydrolase family protein [Candidatus Neomarinimicrobiota bacterium]